MLALIFTETELSKRIRYNNPVVLRVFAYNSHELLNFLDGLLLSNPEVFKSIVCNYIYLRRLTRDPYHKADNTIYQMSQ